MEEIPPCLEGTHLKLRDFVWPDNDRPSSLASSPPDADFGALPGKHAAAAGSMDDEGFPEVDLGLPDEALVPVLRSAASTWGFFRVRNHGIPQTLLDSIAGHSRRFFELLQPSDKLAIARRPPLPLGYTSIARSSEIRSWSEALHLMPGKDRICSLFQQVPAYKEAQSFGLDIADYFSLVGALANRIIMLLFHGLMVDTDEVKRVFDSIESSTLRINYYPACPVADLTYGSPPHKDYGGLAILHQDDVGGLEVFKDGRWVAVAPERGFLIVNIGDLIQIMSNGRYQSALHRSLVKSSQPRLSFVFFHFPSDDTLIAPMSKLVTEDGPAKYKSFYMRDYKSTFGMAQKANHSPSLFFKEANNVN